MALTRDFKVTIQERVLTDPEFRVGLLTQAAECLLDNEINVAKALLRDYVNASQIYPLASPHSSQDA